MKASYTILFLCLAPWLLSAQGPGTCERIVPEVELDQTSL